ncbi:hypothetical protein GCM10029978_090000 [Actinoallomurus acanthiterrae]
MSEPILTVDVGTSATSGALLTGNGVRLVKEPSGLHAWPSAVCQDGERLLVGTAADRRKRVRPAHYQDEFKRELGSSTPIVLGDRSYQPHDLVTAIVAAVKAEAERLHGEPVSRAVLTMPASYEPGDPRRELLLKAGEAAGFRMTELLAEPVAAALAPLSSDPFGPGDLVLVYDFGGGTFDTALVRIGDYGTHDVLGRDAVDDVGGRDMDAALFTEVRRIGGDHLAGLLRPAADGEAARTAQRIRLELVDFVRQLKHQLSDTDRVEDYFSPADLLVVLNRKRLAELAAPLLARTLVCCRGLLTRAKINISQVTAVLLAGGTSRMPMVAEYVSRELGRPVRFAEDPELAVVYGAAAWARQIPTRRAGPTPPGQTDLALRWEFPAGVANLLRWRIAVGQAFGVGTVMAEARLESGAIWELHSDVSGVVQRLHVQQGRPIVSGDWLVTATAPADSEITRFREAAEREMARLQARTEREARLLRAAAASDAEEVLAEAGDERDRVIAAADQRLAELRAAIEREEQTLDGLEAKMAEARIEAGQEVDKLTAATEREVAMLRATVAHEVAEKRAAAERHIAKLRTTTEREVAQLRASTKRERDEILITAKRYADEMRAQAQRILEESEAQRARAEAEFEIQLAARREEAERQDAERHAAAVSATQRLVAEAELRAALAEQRAIKATEQTK